MAQLEIWFPAKPFVVTQPFGVNGDFYKAHGINVAGHTGQDIRAFHGEKVRATHNGIVTHAGVDGNEGWGVVIRTKIPYDYNGKETYFKTIYWHLMQNIPVKAGQEVKVGDVIGYADNTGFSFGDHLHFGLKPIERGETEWIWANSEQGNGYYGAIDPEPYWNGYFAEDATVVLMNLSKQVELLLKVVEMLKKLIWK